MHSQLKKPVSNTANRRLVLAVREPTTRFKVGDSVNVLLGAELVKATVIEDRGALGTNGSQVVRVEVKAADELHTSDLFEVPASAILKLKAPGIGQGRATDLELARRIASENARRWVLREFDAEDSRKTEMAFNNPADLEQEFERRGLTSSQRRALYQGGEVVLSQ